jgi:hypothetical protein
MPLTVILHEAWKFVLHSSMVVPPPPLSLFSAKLFEILDTLPLLLQYSFTVNSLFAPILNVENIFSIFNWMWSIDRTISHSPLTPQELMSCVEIFLPLTTNLIRIIIMAFFISSFLLKPV